MGALGTSPSVNAPVTTPPLKMANHILPYVTVGTFVYDVLFYTGEGSIFNLNKQYATLPMGSFVVLDRTVIHVFTLSPVSNGLRRGTPRLNR